MDNYRGTYRASPDYPVEGCDLAHPLNQGIPMMFSEDEDFTDVAMGMDLLGMVKTHIKTKDYELMGFARDEDEPRTDLMFLGYDISFAYLHSILWEVLSQECPGEEQGDELIEPMYAEPLFNVYKRFFRERLNEFGLFSEFVMVKWFMDCVLAADNICPNMFEYPSIDRHKITSVYKIL